MKLENLKAIVDFVRFYDELIDEIFEDYVTYHDMDIHFTIDFGLLNLRTNKIIKDELINDYYNGVKEEFFYYDYDYKMHIPLSKAFTYLLYNISLDKPVSKKGIEIKSYLVIAKDIDELFRLLTEESIQNIIISKKILSSVFKETFAFNHEIVNILDKYQNMSLENIFELLTNQKNIYLPIIVEYDYPGVEQSYKLILEFEHDFIINDNSDDALINDMVKNVSINKVKEKTFEYIYKHGLVNLIKFFSIVNTDLDYVSLKSYKMASSLKLVFDFEYMKELLCLYFADRILAKI